MRPGRVGAIHSAYRGHHSQSIVHNQQRLAAAAKRKRREDELKHRHDAAFRMAMARYDTNHTGRLEREQLEQVMRAWSDADEDVQHEDVTWLLKLCDKDAAGGIDASDLPEAFSWWEHYRTSLPVLRALLLKYDVSDTGMLELSELQAMLTHLNDGHPVEEEEAAQILALCDTSQTEGLNTSELMYAISVWYASHDDLSRVELSSVPKPPRLSDVDEIRKTIQQRKKAKKAQSGCSCVLS
ncbi:hypothetical protein DIPPA_02032 [Diplonema papillatum]|nr:hypothetical protein DIPPA_02032 [Diplonema papillatum]